MPVKFQSDMVIITSNPTASRLHEIYGKTATGWTVNGDRACTICYTCMLQLSNLANTSELSHHGSIAIFYFKSKSIHQLFISCYLNILQAFVLFSFCHINGSESVQQKMILSTGEMKKGICPDLRFPTYNMISLSNITSISSRSQYTTLYNKLVIDKQRHLVS